MMSSSRFALVVIGAGCVAAAGVGGYLATRQSLSSGAAAALTADRAPVTPASSPAATAASGPVAEAKAEPAPGEQAPNSNGSTERRQPERRPEATTRPVRKTASASQAPRTRSAAVQPAEERASVTPSTPVTAAQPAPEILQVPEPPTAARTEGGATVPEPIEPRFEEIVVAADSVVGLQMAKSITSDRAKIEDSVEARVVRDVRASGQVAIPAGTQALGSVMIVERGGKFRERARLGVRFHTLVLADGTRLPISTETIFRYGEAPGNGSAAKIGGGAVAGAILGAIIGGAKGAAIGATTGAGAGTAVVMSGERDAAAFPAGTEMTARILSPVSVTIEK